MKIKKNDTVLIIKGKDRGKAAKIERVLPKTGQVILVGNNLYKKHLKPSQKNPHGGIIDINMPISASNLMPICPRCEKVTRIKYKIAGGKKMRICHRCQEILDK